MALGGKREGAGRKRKSEKFSGQIAAAEQKIADRLPSILDNLLHLADGGYERVEEKFERIARKNDEGEFVRNRKGEVVYDLVLVERKVSIADKDRAANTYLVDRILGRPTERQEIEADISGEIEVTTAAKKKAAKELDEWRSEQSEKLKRVTKPNAAP